MVSVIYKSNIRIGNMIISRVLMISCKMFLRYHLRNTKSIALIGSGGVRVDRIGDAL